MCKLGALQKSGNDIVPNSNSACARPRLQIHLTSGINNLFLQLSELIGHTAVSFITQMLLA